MGLGGGDFLLLMALDFVYTGCTRKTRIIDVVYNASNNELVRTKTLVKNCIVLVDSLPYRQWYEAHYATPLGRKKGAKLVCGENTNVSYLFLFSCDKYSCGALKFRLVPCLYRLFGAAIMANGLKC